MKKTCVRLASVGALLLNSAFSMEIVNTDPLNTTQSNADFIWPKKIISMITVGENNYRMDKPYSQNKLKEHLKEIQQVQVKDKKTSLRITQVVPEEIEDLNKILAPYAENIQYLFIKLHPHCIRPNLPNPNLLEMLKQLSIIENLDGLGIEEKFLQDNNRMENIKALEIMKNHPKHAFTPGKEFAVFFTKIAYSKMEYLKIT